MFEGSILKAGTQVNLAKDKMVKGISRRNFELRKKNK